MAQPVKKNDQPSAFPAPPSLRLHGETNSVDEPSHPAAAEAWILDGESVSVQPGTHLPRRCIRCGDSMDVLQLPTIRGNIRYHLCREHVVVAVARMACGVFMALLAMLCIASSFVGDPIVSNTGSRLCVLIALGGAALAYWSLPVRTAKLVDGRHRLSRLHPEILTDMQRSPR